jgi:hypothetical protein
VRAQRAGRNPRAVTRSAPELALNAPLRAFEAPRQADIVVAALVGERESGLRIAGIGHGTDVTALGDRDWLAQPALQTAASHALRDAACTVRDLDLVEVDGMTLTDEALALEAIGVAPAGAGFAAYAERASINPSGGSAAGWCYPAMGLVRFAECALRLREHGKRALATGASPRAGQIQTAVVLEAA